MERTRRAPPRRSSRRPALSRSRPRRALVAWPAVAPLAPCPAGIATFFDLFDEAGQNTAPRGASCSSEMLEHVARRRRARPRDPDGRAGGRPDHPRHHPAPQLDLRHADRPRGHLRPRDPALDDIVDYIEEAADFLGLYQIEAPMEQAQALAEVLVEACEQLAEALAAPARRSRTSTTTGSRSTGSRTTATGSAARRVASLFANGIDPMVVIRWKDIFERLEEAIDATETRGAHPRGHRHQERAERR